ncbi:PAS domain-containing sensor histidine kinase [Christiangramia sp. SM2212]|uniref:histidine kinase n=1 Tax=Christiangramia sediminicola TaxID=3073267 RepID=A0ABU1EU46_9FLAO|nr:PAS domain-containing sensor histidine kinase [Christiangramia sp. SM2212]MDR5591918.1 PAS domain-containing sensor histidine kinase [Christiangramia sp. SM2212]
MREFFKNKEDVFDTLFQAASEGIIIVDANQNVTAANKAADEIFGYEHGELIGQHLDVLIPKDYHHRHHGHFNKFLKDAEKRQMGHGRDLYGVKKDGSLFPVEAGLNPFMMNGEKFVMSLVIDISVRKETQRQIQELNNELEDKIRQRTRELRETVQELKDLNLDLEDEIKKRKLAEKRIKTALQKEKELNELKTKFLSLVSHEFKTPLSGILTSATLTEKYTTEEQQEKREKHLVTIRNKVHYLNNILNDFLSIERLDSGRGQYKFSKFGLRRFINEVIYNANITLKEGQEIIYPKEIEDVELYQDEKILELIVSNLLGNAIKYSSENTSIWFNINFEGDDILFEIKDEGRGIPQKDQKHIFERYFRAENALLDQGTGIGLNIAKSHISNLGGSIEFESQENVGTTFKVQVPMDKS